jgi:hypothetical protein
MMTLSQFGWDSEKLKIPGMDNHNYEILYYNPYTLEIVNTENVDSGIDGKLGLVDYPMMHGLNLSGLLPFYFFKAHRSIEGDQFSPLLEDMYSSAALAEVSSNSTKILSNGSNEFDIVWNVHPNPTSDRVSITCGKVPIGSFQLVDAVGRSVLSGQTTNSSLELDLNSCPSGVFYLITTNFTTIIVKI